jgi:hypothetical protein
MNVAARRRHRVMILLLGLAVPVIFVLGLMSRQTMPIAVAKPVSVQGNKVAQVAFSIGDQSLSVDVHQQAGQLSLVWQSKPALPYPDLLIYWQNGDAFENALLIGNYLNQQMVATQVVPSAASLEGAQLVLYSLAHQQEIARQQVVATQGGLP